MSALSSASTATTTNQMAVALYTVTALVSILPNPPTTTTPTILTPITIIEVTLTQAVKPPLSPPVLLTEVIIDVN